MKNKRHNPFQNPTKLMLWVVLTSFVVGTFCVIYASTAGFEITPFQKKNLVFGILLLISSITTIQVVKNYFWPKMAIKDSN